MKVAVCTLSQNLEDPSGLLSWFSQLAQFLPQIDPRTEYHFVVSNATRNYITARSSAFAQTIGWDNTHRAMRIFSEHILVGSWAKRAGIDVLLMANAGSAPLFLPKPIKLVQGIYGFHHANLTDLRPVTRYYRKTLFDYTIRRADRIVINSEYSRNELTRLAPTALSKSFIIPHGCNETLFHPGPPTSNEEDKFSALGIPEPFISFVSQMYPYKNAHVAVEAFCRFIRVTNAPHTLAIIGKFSANFGEGEAYRDRLKIIARAHGCENRLHFRAGISATALRTIYRKSDAYIQSSLSETFGRTSLEAMACGCPIIAARAAATPEVLGDAGLYYEGTNAQGCADALIQIFTDRHLRDACVARGLERAKGYSLENEARLLVALFTDVMRT